MPSRKFLLRVFTDSRKMPTDLIEVVSFGCFEVATWRSRKDILSSVYLPVLCFFIVHFWDCFAGKLMSSHCYCRTWWLTCLALKMELCHQGHRLHSKLCAVSPCPSGTIPSLHLPSLAQLQVSRGPAISFLPFLILKLSNTSRPLLVCWENALLQHVTAPAQDTDTWLHYLRWC